MTDSQTDRQEKKGIVIKEENKHRKREREKKTGMHRKRGEQTQK